jgi:hypothetical protein
VARIVLILSIAAVLAILIPLTIDVYAEDDGEVSDDSSSDSGNSGDSGDNGDSGDSSDSGSSGGTYEDDGEIVPDNKEDAKQQAEDQQKEYDDRNLPKYDPETGTYNDADNNGIDDDSKANDDEENLSTCNDTDLRYHQRDCKTSFGLTCEKNNPNGDAACESDKPVTVRCSNGSTAEVASMCPTKLPYCHKVPDGYQGSCHDIKDIDQSTGLYLCNDGTQKADYKDCKDVSGYNYNNNKKSNNKDSSSSQPQTNPNEKVCTVVEWLNPYNGIKCSNDEELSKLGNFKQQTVVSPVPAPDTPRTIFDLESCKFYGAQDAVSGYMDQMSYTKCLTVGDGVYTSAYYDGINAMNKAMPN